MEGLPDLDALLAGDKAAWDRFVAQASRVVFAAVHRRLGPAGRSDEAEDVVQEVFVKLCRGDFKLLRGFAPARAKLSTFLTVVATTTAIDHLRRNRQASHAVEDLPESLLSQDPDYVERVKIPEGLLSGRQKAVMTLLYDRDMDAAEAANLLGIDPQTVRSMHHKALTKLRAHFALDG
jgi:RNA polymerase sigma-70 factor (ECF subfamily)